MKRYATEFIGTFFLVLTIGCTVLSGGKGVIPPIAIGSALMVMVYAAGHISGAHFNPAVTIAIWIRGRCKTSDVVPYIVAQIVGAAAAACAALYLRPDATVDVATLDPAHAILGEYLFTFALAWVVLNVATSPTTHGNSFYGLAIGFTVMTAVFALGGISGGVLNPAVAVAVTLMGLSSWANIWIYMVGTFAGAITAAFVYKAIIGDDAPGLNTLPQ